MSLLGDKSGGLIFIVVLYSVKVALGVRADGSGAMAYTNITTIVRVLLLVIHKYINSY